VQALQDWLRGMDGNKGALLQYEEPLCRHFNADLRRIAEARIGEAKLEGGVVSTVDPAFFETIGCEKLAHKIAIAKGLKRLVSSLK